MSEWINVKKQLPKVGEFVLTAGWCWDDPKCGRLYHVLAYQGEPGLWAFQDPEDDEPYAPTHWMPFPKAPV